MKLKLKSMEGEKRLKWTALATSGIIDVVNIEAGKNFHRKRGRLSDSCIETPDITVFLLVSYPVLDSEYTERKIIKDYTKVSIPEYSVLTTGHHDGFGIHIPFICDLVSGSVSIPQKETNSFVLFFFSDYFLFIYFSIFFFHLFLLVGG